jgi:hypothetical protein
MERPVCDLKFLNLPLSRISVLRNSCLSLDRLESHICSLMNSAVTPLLAAIPLFRRGLLSKIIEGILNVVGFMATHIIVACRGAEQHRHA